MVTLYLDGPFDGLIWCSTDVRLTFKCLLNTTDLTGESKLYSIECNSTSNSNPNSNLNILGLGLGLDLSFRLRLDVGLGSVLNSLHST